MERPIKRVEKERIELIQDEQIGVRSWEGAGVRSG